MENQVRFRRVEPEAFCLWNIFPRKTLSRFESDGPTPYTQSIQGVTVQTWNARARVNGLTSANRDKCYSYRVN